MYSPRDHPPGTPAKVPSGYVWQDKSFTLKKEFWTKCYKGGDTLDETSEWTIEWNKDFERTHKYCVLSIKRHEMYINKKGKISLTVDGKCTHSVCSRFKFKCHQYSLNFRDCEVFVFRDKEFNHIEGEIRGRPIKGKRRLELANQLKDDAPFIKRWKLIEGIPDDVLENGNINNVPSVNVLRKISGKLNAQNDLDKNRTIFMHKLIEKLRNEWSGEKLHGYVQLYAETPVFYLLLMAEEVLKCFLKSRSVIPNSSSRKKFLFLNLDATGSMLGKSFKSLRTIYVYSLILPGYGVYPPLDIATFASSAHSTEDITIYLDKVVRNLKLLSSHRPVVDKVETDFSLPLLQALWRAFNGMSLILYFKMILIAMLQKKRYII
ncbi:hypothetical protein QAD02_013178 [Eretmocerus hayati]|uniref:Uncharacterized protein n=1 Tax=Eretmocerus hayati TaxID=131215 RepID=A0ACC2P1T9_9HYME|nr:hypothetical protein QAD02_013178 [Eretmocerus hayati]